MQINRRLLQLAMTMALAHSTSPPIDTQPKKQSFTSKRKQEAHQQRMRKKGR